MLKASLIVALSARAAFADETIVIVDDAAARDRQRHLDDAPFVTVLHPDDDLGATASVADAVATSAGALSRSLGGLGAFQSISVRGQAPGQTEVLVDGVPLARLAQVTTDLSRFQLDDFGQVDFYRGAVPVALGGAGVGGALDLVTRLGPDANGDRWRASLGMGSFGARHARVHYGDDHGSVQSSTTIDYVAANGDYRYFDNHGTLLNKTDDTYETRQNNSFTQLDAASRVGTNDAAGGLRLAYKDQGLPGSIAQPSLHANLRTADAIADARAEDVHVYALVEAQRLRDPDGELGLGMQDRDYLTLSAGANGALHTHGLTAGAELRADRFSDGMVEGDRAGGALLASYDANLSHDLIVTPAVRLDLLHTRPTPTPLSTEIAPPRWDAVPSPRVTARLMVRDDIALKGSGGWYVRMPTLLELFGDRGFVLGSPDLRPERGPSADLGGVWSPVSSLGPIDRILVEVDGFATRAHDTIAIVSTVGYTQRAMNIGDTQTYGAEAIASARIKPVTLTASYTRLESEQVSGDPNLAGKPIPRDPTHVLYAKADVALPWFIAWGDVSYQSDANLDPAGLGVSPGRALVGVGAKVPITAGFALIATIDNLLDARISDLPLNPPPSPTFTTSPIALGDVAGFPLPGRSFYLTLQWSHR